MLPEQADHYPPGPLDPIWADCFLIYAESRADPTEEELHADLLATLNANRQDTAALVTDELVRRASAIPPLPSVRIAAADRQIVPF